MGSASGKIVLKISFMDTIWVIWKVRNARFFEGMVSLEADLAEKVHSYQFQGVDPSLVA